MEIEGVPRGEKNTPPNPPREESAISGPCRRGPESRPGSVAVAGDRGRRGPGNGQGKGPRASPPRRPGRQACLELLLGT